MAKKELHRECCKGQGCLCETCALDWKYGNCCTMTKHVCPVRRCDQYRDERRKKAARGIKSDDIRTEEGRLHSTCGSCGASAPKKTIYTPSGQAVEVFDDDGECPCGGTYHRTYEAEK